MRFVKVSIFGALLTVVSMLCGCGDGCHKEHWGPKLGRVFAGEEVALFVRSKGWDKYCNSVASGSEDEYSRYEYFLALSWEDSVRNVTEPYEEWRAKSKNPTIYGTRAFPQMMANDYAVAIRDNGEAFQTWLWRWDGQIVEIGGKWGEEWKSGKTGAFHNRLFIDKSYVDRDVLYLSFSGGHSRAEGWAPVFYAQNLRTGKASTLDVAFDVDTRSWNDFLVVDSVLYGVAILSHDTGVVYRIDGSVRDSVFLDLAVLGYADAVKFQVEDLTAALFKEEKGIGVRVFETTKGGLLSAADLSVLEWSDSTRWVDIDVSQLLVEHEITADNELVLKTRTRNVNYGDWSKW